MSKPTIVILGAGYGGIMTAIRLQKELSLNQANVILVNKHNYHYQTTWLHENAAGTLHHDKTRIPIEDIIDTNKIHFVQDTVKEIKKDEKVVILENKGELTYDYLVIGLGSDPETFGIPGLKEHAFGIRSINSVRQIREHIEYCFSLYNNTKENRDQLVTIVVGGAGFTGIEFVGELADRIPELCKEYDVPREKVRVVNVEAAPTVLPGFDVELVEYAMYNLERRGIEFLVGVPIKECYEGGVLLGNGEDIKAATIVWTGGVRGNHLIEDAGFETMRGRVKVEKDLRMPGHDYIFVIGDCALIINEEINRPYPPTAQIAMQQAYTVAKNLKALIAGGSLEEFHYHNKGTVASLGRGEAIGVVGNKKLFGSTAAAMKKVIDNRWLYLIGGIPMVLKKGKLNLFK
ncbi:NAD(P)/FAD-dependent oxidoreductase [Fictibacillus gelatini]|uniref:NAD(P)/FAD-dependent oxidoreductase n=1 Tax=Fictibacillus gelatini TaxID=225985 RepID=UPI00041E7BE2|nr:NAD(P)/FAD-dependent oxidoreductase [Fictibacillus gelatini]